MNLGFRYAALWGALLALGVSTSSCTEKITETKLAWDLGESGYIPQGFRTYTLFINTSVEYHDQTAADRLRSLERHFKSFADSIGDENLAVWVNDPGSDALSVSRGKYFADVFSNWADSSIEYSNGPYVMVSDRHPNTLKDLDPADRPADRPSVIVIGFNNISADRIIEVLNFVEARIRRAEALSAGRFQLKILWVELKTLWDDDEFREFATGLLKDVTIALIERS